MIITFANHKGGVGKTSLALVVAEGAIQNGFPVQLIDLDPQQNFKQLITAWNPDITVETKLPDAIKNNALTIIDTPPGMGEATEKAIKQADRVVVPVDSHISSIQGISGVLNKNPNIVIVLNKFRPESGYDQEVANYFQQEFVLKRMDHPISVITLPVNNFMTVNVSRSQMWNYGMRKKNQEQFENFIKALLTGGVNND